MGQPAVVMNDKITGQCPGHMMPGPSGSQPAGPLPFSAGLVQGLANSVLIGGKAAAVKDSSGPNLPPHPGIIPNPPEEGKVMVGSMTVLFEGKAAAYSGCMVSMCMSIPGQVQGTASTVLIGA